MQTVANGKYCIHKLETWKASNTVFREILLSGFIYHGQLLFSVIINDILQLC